MKMETYERTWLEILEEYCKHNTTNTNDLSWYYWRVQRLEEQVRILTRIIEELTEGKEQ